MVRLPFNWAGSSEDPDAKRSRQTAGSEQKVPYNLKDHYHTLAVPRNASEKEIEAAYTRLLEKYGPHINVGEYDNPEMQIKMLGEIQEAYRVLMNPSRRKVHDATLARYYGKEDDLTKLSRKTTKNDEKNK